MGLGGAGGQKLKRGDLRWHPIDCAFWFNYKFPLDLFVCFVALRPKSTAMVIAGRSVHLITLFPGQA